MDTEKRPQFGGRLLTNPSDVFSRNAWDNVEWDEHQEAEAKRTVEEAHSHRMNQKDADACLGEPSSFWNKFYTVHDNKFFRDRNWLFTEFGELGAECSVEDAEDPGAASDAVYPGSGAASDAVYPGSGAASDAVYPGSGAASDAVYPGSGAASDAVYPGSGAASDVVYPGSGAASDAVYPGSGAASYAVYPGSGASRRVWEVGCGAGNTVFPLLAVNSDRRLFVYASDFSSTAVTIVQSSPQFESARCHAFVHDLADDSTPPPFPESSLDVVVLVFVLSALQPCHHGRVLARLARYLKPGGLLLFRDYGRYDMAQLRFKKGRCVDENLYARGDGTLVYFFTQDELGRLMTSAGLEQVQNHVDRRLQVNRVRQLKMYRVWVQCKYRKPCV